MTASALLRTLSRTATLSRDTTDAELVKGCLAGDQAAERALYDRHVDALYRTAFRMCGDADTAADITQDAFIRAFSRLDQFRGASALRTWLISIVASSAGMTMRKGRWLRMRSSPIEDQPALPTADREWTELGGHLDAAIARLPEKMRVVLIMHDVEGLTHQDIGTALGIPSGTSKARLSHARARLRGMLEVHWRDFTT